MPPKDNAQQGMMEILDTVIESIQHVRNNQDYDWIRKYGNIFLSVAKDDIDKAININELPTNDKGL